MLMMFACLGRPPIESSPNADDAGWFGALGKEAAQLMLMVLGVVVHLPSESPGDADDAV